MRRLATVALMGSLALAACTDQTRESPTEPSVPSDAATTTCGAVPFPMPQLANLINKVFPKGQLRIEAVARAGVIKILWDTCRESAAQKAVVAFVDWMNQNLEDGKLTGTDADRSLLIKTMFAGVGLSVPASTNMGPDFGIGFFDPNSPDNTLVVNQNSTALVDLEPGSFDEPTTIVVSRNPDNFELTNFEGNQFPPYFDYNAINPSGNHVLKDEKTAIVAFCLLDPAVTYPENRRIGHNPVAGAPGFPFEILEPVELSEEQAGALNCENLAPNTTVIGGFGQGLPGLANAAWRSARYYLGPLTESLLLPQALHAATVGTLPPPGGRASSLSPFGIVEADAGGLSFTRDPNSNNTSTNNYFKGVTIDTCGDGCFPAVQILDSDETPVGVGTDVTVSLIQTQGTGGVLSGTLIQPIQDLDDETSDQAIFNDLTISAPGTYRLMFTAPGATPITSGEFNVYTLAFTLQPWANAGHTFATTDTLGQNAEGFHGPVVQVSIIDHLGSVVTSANDRIQTSITGGAELQGTTTVSAVNGIASFADNPSNEQNGLMVSIEGPVNGAALQASADYFGVNPVQATSITFNVHSSHPTVSAFTITFDGPPTLSNQCVGSICGEAFNDGNYTVYQFWRGAEDYFGGVFNILRRLGDPNWFEEHHGQGDISRRGIWIRRTDGAPFTLKSIDYRSQIDPLFVPGTPFEIGTSAITSMVSDELGTVPSGYTRFAAPATSTSVFQTLDLPGFEDVSEVWITMRGGADWDNIVLTQPPPEIP